MNHKDWSIVSRLLDDEMSPFVYGRHLQMVVDLSKLDQSRDRRLKIWSIVETLSPLEVINEARRISLRIVQKIIHKCSKDNGVYDLEKSLHFEALDNDKLYTGRCLQFLLDTDRQKYNYSELCKLSADEIKQLAAEVKNNLLIYQSGPYPIHCGERDCTWRPGNDRCDCGNRKLYYHQESLKDIDETYPSGYVDYF